MIVGTTPTFTLNINDDDTLNFNEVNAIYFTIRQGDIKYTKTGNDINIVDKNTVQVSLTQAETLTFRHNLEAEIQLNWTYNDGVRAASRVKKIPLFKNLLKEVIQ